MDTKKILKWTAVLSVFVILAVVYKFYNPYESNFFPKCPFRAFSGLQCPGCGSQRALHYLLNFDIGSAFAENMLLVLSIPYIITGVVFDSMRRTDATFLKWRKRLFGLKAIYSILTIIIVFWILRNIF